MSIMPHEETLLLRVKKIKKSLPECNKSAASAYYGQMMFEKRKVNRIFAERNKHSIRNGQTGL